VRSNFEQTTARYLEAIGYEVFSPTFQHKRRGYDRVRPVRIPVFPGYIFCRLEVHNRLPVLSAPGMVHIVGFGSEFIPIPDQELESIRVIIASGADMQPCPYLNVGARVRIVQGPLASIRGILLEVRNKHRLVVSVHLLQRSIIADVDRDTVELEDSEMRDGLGNLQFNRASQSQPQAPDSGMMEGRRFQQEP